MSCAWSGHRTRRGGQRDAEAAVALMKYPARLGECVRLSSAGRGGKYKQTDADEGRSFYFFPLMNGRTHISIFMFVIRQQPAARQNKRRVWTTIPKIWQRKLPRVRKNVCSVRACVRASYSRMPIYGAVASVSAPCWQLCIGRPQSLHCVPWCFLFHRLKEKEGKTKLSLSCACAPADLGEPEGQRRVRPWDVQRLILMSLTHWRSESHPESVPVHDEILWHHNEGGSNIKKFWCNTDTTWHQT